MKRVLCMLLICTLLLTLTACERNVTDIRVYERYAEHDRYLPSLDELGEYTSVQALYHHDSALIFFWDAYNLIVSYGKEDYEQAKSAVEERYTFRDDTNRSAGERKDNDRELVDYPPYCDLCGYHLRMLDGQSFPNDVYFVGTNDSEKKIAYVRFYDSDLDGVDSLEAFLMDECGWRVLIQKNIVTESETPFRSEGRWLYVVI